MIPEKDGKAEQVQIEDQCPECESRLFLDSARAELVCSMCHLVVADSLILPGTEYPGKSDPSGERGVSSIREPDTGKIMPQLHFDRRDSHGRPVGQKTVWVLRRTAQRHNLRSDERSDAQMESRIRRFASQRGIPQSIIVRAIYLYNKSKDEHVLRKPSLNDWALAVLLIACRESRYMITAADLVGSLSKDAGWPEKQQRQRRQSSVFSYYNLICRKLGLNPPRPVAENYIMYFSGKLGVTGPVISDAVVRAKEYVSEEPNSTPDSVAAASLFISMRNNGDKITQKTFCDTIGLSEISLRDWARTLGGYDQRIIPVAPMIDPSQLVDSPELRKSSTTASEVLKRVLGGPERDHEHRDPEQGPEDHPEDESSPNKSERDNGRTDHDEKDVQDVQALEERRDERKVPLDPSGLRDLLKERADAHHQASDRKDAPVHRHQRPPRRRGWKGQGRGTRRGQRGQGKRGHR